MFEKCKLCKKDIINYWVLYRDKFLFDEKFLCKKCAMKLKLLNKLEKCEKLCLAEKMSIWSIIFFTIICFPFGAFLTMQLFRKIRR